MFRIVLLVLLSNIAFSLVPAAYGKNAAPSSHEPQFSNFEMQLSYRFQGDYSDNGLTETAEGSSPPKTFVLSAPYIGIELAGEHSKRLRFSAEFQLTESSLDVFLVERDLRDWVSLKAGIGRPNILGFEWRSEEYLRLTESRYSVDAPLNEVTPIAEFQFSLGSFGLLNLQFTDDVIATGNIGRESLRFNEIKKQPATLLQYEIDFGAVAALLQFAEYDLRHSFYTGFGLKAKIGSFFGVIDFSSDRRAFRYSEDRSVELFDEHQSIIARLSYRMDAIEPFIKYSQHLVFSGDASQDQGVLADNEATYSILGLKYIHAESAVHSFIYYEQLQANDTSRARESTDKRKTETIAIGVMGTI